MIPAVSVIIPNFNHAAFLSKRIESVINQTCRDIEIIILDDCSTDNSREIIEQYSPYDTRIRTFYNTENSGSPFRQWRKGIEAAKADLIWIAESDDYADAAFLQRLTSKLFSNVDAGIAYCQSNFVNTEGQIVGNHIDNLRFLNDEQWDYDFCMSGREVLASYMIILNIIPNASAVVFRKSLSESVDWDKLFEFRLAGDRYFWISLLKSTNLCFVADSLNYFRIDGNTVRNRFIHTTTYLQELSNVILDICSITNVPLKAKYLAIRQWMRTFKRIKRMPDQHPVRFLLAATSALLKTLGILITK